jgi:hypothetical protein
LRAVKYLIGSQLIQSSKMDPQQVNQSGKIDQQVNDQDDFQSIGDGDEVQRVIRISKPFIDPNRYCNSVPMFGGSDGIVKIEETIEAVEDIGNLVSGWGDAEKIMLLKMRLEKTPLKYFTKNEEVKAAILAKSWSKVKFNLIERFGDTEPLESKRMRFETMRQKVDEDLRDYATRVEELGAMAYPTYMLKDDTEIKFQQRQRQAAIVTVFCRGIRDSNLHMLLSSMEFLYLKDALQKAVSLQNKQRDKQRQVDALGVANCLAGLSIAEDEGGFYPLNAVAAGGAGFVHPELDYNSLSKLKQAQPHGSQAGAHHLQHGGGQGQRQGAYNSQYRGQQKKFAPAQQDQQDEHHAQGQQGYGSGYKQQKRGGHSGRGNHRGRGNSNKGGYYQHPQQAARPKCYYCGATTHFMKECREYQESLASQNESKN